MDPQEGERNVKVKFDIERKKIHVTDRGRRPLRMIDLRYGNKKVHFRVCEPSNFISVRVPDEIDLVSKTSHGVRVHLLMFVWAKAIYVNSYNTWE